MAYSRRTNVFIQFHHFKEKNNGDRRRLNNSSKTFQINKNLLVFLKAFFSAVSKDHQDFNRGIRGCKTGSLEHSALTSINLLLTVSDLSPEYRCSIFSYLKRKK